MNADPWWAPVLGALIQNLLVPVLIAGAAWAVTKLPGPLQEFLGSAVHERDMERMTETLSRAAWAVAERVAGVPPADGMTDGAPVAMSDAVDAVVGYVEENRRDLLKKMDPPAQTLRTMAIAELTKATTEVLKARAAPAAAPSPPPV